MARPEKWKDEYLRIAEHACQLGATDKELADMLGVSARTIYYWQSTKPEFAAVLKTGKEASDERVERSLYHRAVGYKYDAVKIFMPAGAKQPVYAPYVEHVAPDTTAMIFWLKNRRPDLWRDKSEQVVRHEHVANLTDDELARIAAIGGNGNPAKKEGPGKPH